MDVLDENKNLLQEIFAWPGGEPVISLDDEITLYTSPELKQKFIEGMAEHKLTAPVSKTIQELIEKNRLIPCWVNKGLGSIILFKIFAPLDVKSIGSFYAPSENVVALLMDNSTFFLFYVPNRTLAYLTLHELCHYAAGNSSSFPSLSAKILTKYYEVMFHTLFEIFAERRLNPKPDLTKRATKYWSNLVSKEQKRTADIAKGDDIKNLILKCFGDYLGLKDVAQEIAYDVKILVDTARKDLGKILTNIEKFKYVLVPLYIAYGDGLGLKNLTTFAIQEYWCASEVVCVCAEKPSKFPVVYKVISSI